MAMVGKSLFHYRVLEALGRGGIGIIYKAEDTKLDQTVVIKVLPSPAAVFSELRLKSTTQICQIYTAFRTGYKN